MEMAQIIKIVFYVFLVFGHQQFSKAEDKEKKDDKDDKKVFYKPGKGLEKLLGTVEEVYGKASEFWSEYQAIHDMLTSHSDYEINSIEDRLKRINAKLDTLSMDVADFKSQLFNKLDVMLNNLGLKDKMNDLFTKITKIDSYFELFLREMDPNKVHRKSTTLDLAQSILTAAPTGVYTLLNEMHIKLLESSTSNENILTLLANEDLASVLMCPRQQSAQQLVFNLYRKIALTEIRGYIMTIFANRVLENLEKPSVKTSEEEEAKTALYRRISVTFAAVRLIMRSSSREVYRCDPRNHVEGITYARFGPVLQRYIMHETDPYNNADLDKTFFGGCDQNCAYYTLTEQKTCTHDVCSRNYGKQCNGNIRNCEYIHKKLTVCLARDGYRRYQYIKTGDDDVFGHNTTCSESTISTNSLNRIYVDCDYCVCTCEDNIGNIDRYINLRDVTSDIEQNKVITGVRINSVKNVFHIQIKQGKLSKNGQIDGDSEWKPVEAYTIRDKGVVKGRDFHDITWEKRTVCLDDFDSPRNQILTGLRFELVKNHVKLAVRTTKFHFNTGELYKDQSNWQSNPNFATSDERTELDLEKLDIPIFSQNHMPDSETNQFLYLTTSSLDKDAGQNMLPFIDIQPVESKPPVPLSGVGLIHKGDKGSGGFLTFKLFTYNLEPHLRDKIVHHNVALD